MKKILYILFSLIAVCFFQACDIIGESERFREMPLVEAKKSVLLIDFTDQGCVNCPDAAQIIEGLKEIHGEALVTVSMHASSSTYPLVTEEGNAYEKYFETDKIGHPAAVIDGGAPNTDRLAWGGIVLEKVKEEPPVAIKLTSSYNEENKELTIESTLTAFNALALKYELWLTEDNIIGIQKFPSDRWDMEYEHNHVFRAAINGLWGENIAMDAAEEKTLTHKITLNDNWKPEDMHIIGFVFEDGSKRVHQAIEIKLIN